MSFRPVPLAVFFPSEPEPATQLGLGEPSEVGQDATPGATPDANHNAHTRTASQGSSGAVGSSTHAQSSSAARADKESSSETWDDTETYDDKDDDDEQGDSGLPQAPKYVWLSDEERLRVAFKRTRASAEKVDLDRSPFFPKTAAEYVGLKGDMMETRAARLRAKVEEKEKMLEGLKNARWKTILVVGASGEIEEKLVPIYHGSHEAAGCGSPPQRPSSVGGVEESTTYWYGPFDSPGSVTAAIDTSDCRPRASSSPGPDRTKSNIFASNNCKWPVHSRFLELARANTNTADAARCEPDDTDDSTAFDALAIDFHGPSQLPEHQDNVELLSTAESWVDRQVGAAFDRGFIPRTRSAVVLKEIFTVPPSDGFGETGTNKDISKDQRTHKSQDSWFEDVANDQGRFELDANGQGWVEDDAHGEGWFEDDAYDSDSSFTPSDYQPKRNTNKAKRREVVNQYGAQEYFGQFDSSFTPSDYYRGEPNDIMGRYEDMGGNVAEGHFGYGLHTEDNNHTDSFMPSGGEVHNPKFYMTLDGREEPKGKGKDEGYTQQHVQNHTQPEDPYTTEDNASYNYYYESEQHNNYSFQTTTKPNNHTHSYPTGPSEAASTSTPSDYYYYHHHHP
ncbi:hypothetical protein C8A00DRAFT_36330, partial [Chaetomidium leptoderma]